jgi:hypothetical protein
MLSGKRSLPMRNRSLPVPRELCSRASRGASSGSLEGLKLGFKLTKFFETLLSQVVGTLLFVHCYDQLKERGDRGDDVLDMLSSFELSAEIFTAHLGHTPGGLLGHLEENPPQTTVADRGDVSCSPVAARVGDAEIEAGQFFDMLVVSVAGKIPDLRQKQC